MAILSRAMRSLSPLFALAAVLGWTPHRASLILGNANSEQHDAQIADTVSARIVRNDGSVAPKVRVLLLSTKSFLGLPMNAAELLADASTGRVRFERVRPGKYTLVARWEPEPEQAKSGEQSNSATGVVPTTPSVWWGFAQDVSPNSDDLTITLSPGEKQSVAVTTSSGAPVGEVQIRVALKTANSFAAAPGTTAQRTVTLDRRVSTKAGRFVVDGLAAGEWACVVSIPEFGRTEEFTMRVPSDSPRDILVPQFISIAGEVHAPDGFSAAKAWVGLAYPTTYLSVFEDGQVATYTDQAGKFEIRNARPGRATLKSETRSGNHRAECRDTELILAPGKDLRGVRVELAAVK
jgi:hypothetical protein